MTTSMLTAILACLATASLTATARADRSQGEATKALTATVPRDLAGWSNGQPRLVPLGEGRIRLEYDGAPVGIGAGHPDAAVITGNSGDGPIIGRLPPRR